MARRGDILSEHILWVAKELFLEMGFERASMDLVAARAETSKRSLYARYPSKEKLFVAVVELVRSLFLSGLKMPADYSDEPVEAIVIFCARYLEILLYERSIQMCRLSIAEAARLQEGTEHHFDAIFTEVNTRLSEYLLSTCKAPAGVANEASQSLIAQILYPRFTRALFGLDQLSPILDHDNLAKDFDLIPIRKAVNANLKLYGVYPLANSKDNARRLSGE